MDHANVQPVLRWPVGLRIEARPRASRSMMLGAPLLAALALLVTVALLFPHAGHALYLALTESAGTAHGLGEILLMAAPLTLCGVGLALAFRVDVQNMGAEGQLTMGAIAAGTVALYFDTVQAAWLLPLMVLAGASGGMAWAALPAFLRTRCNASEIVVTLMLVQVAQQLLAYLVRVPLRDPSAAGAPQSAMFHDAALLPLLAQGARANAGFLLALGAVAISWYLCSRAAAGLRKRAGATCSRQVWAGLMASGALAGVAGMVQVAGHIGQLKMSVSPGYGVAAIIVAYVGRLHPLGVLLASLLMALLYVGGQHAALLLQLPAATTGLFQGLPLLYLLAADLLVRYRVKVSAR